MKCDVEVTINIHITSPKDCIDFINLKCKLKRLSIKITQESTFITIHTLSNKFYVISEILKNYNIVKSYKFRKLEVKT